MLDASFLVCSVFYWLDTEDCAPLTLLAKLIVLAKFLRKKCFVARLVQEQISRSEISPTLLQISRPLISPPLFEDPHESFAPTLSSRSRLIN